MRRLILVLTLVVVLVPLTAATSQAAIVACNTNLCFGSDNGDNLWEQKGDGVTDNICQGRR